MALVCKVLELGGNVKANPAILKILSFTLLLTLLAGCFVGKKPDDQPVVPEPGHYVGDPEVSFDVTADGQIQHFSIHMYFDNGNCGLDFKEDKLTEVNEDGSFAIMGEVPKSDKEPLPQGAIVGRFIDPTTIEGRFGPMDCGMGLFSSLVEGTWTAKITSREIVDTTIAQIEPTITSIPTSTPIPDLTDQLSLHQYTTSEWVGAIAYSPDGKTIAAGLVDGRIDLLDVESGTILQTVESKGGRITAISYSPDGKKVAIGMGEPSTTQDTRVLILDTTNWNISRELEAYGAYNVAFSPDGKLLVAGSGNGNAYVWETLTWKFLYTLPGTNSFEKSIGFSPDSQLLAAGSEGGMVTVWKMSDGSLLTTLEPEEVNSFAEFGSVVFLDEGAKIMALQRTTGLKIYSWEVQSGRVLRSLETGLPWDFAVSPDQKTLIVISPDEPIKIFDLQSGDLVATAVQDDVRQVVISPSGETFATFAVGDLVNLWSLTLP
jgi:DNA-binding beta-propeller fold protein YncE